MKLPETGIIAQIDKALEIRTRGTKKRDYLGASQLGEECDRKIWYTYHRPSPKIEPRVQRIFDMGNLIEDYLIKILIESGLEVWDTDKETGKQFGFVDGPVKGHCDGVIKDIPESSKPHLLEIKSAKNSRFNDIKKNGIQSSNDQYWVQAQVYAHKLKLERILFIVMNKDTSELYKERFHVEHIIAEGAITRGKEIVAMKTEPKRADKSSTFYNCKWCNFREECWN